MGGDVVAIFDKPKEILYAENLAQHLSEKLTEYPCWKLSSDRDFFDEPYQMIIGRETLALFPGERWFRFCKNIDGSQLKALNTIHQIVSAVDSKYFLVVPDSSFSESRCIDFLETQSTLEEIESFLIGSGSPRKSPKDIIYTENGCWNSSGYLHYLAR